MASKTFCYIRVSTQQQSINRQLEAFKEFNIDERDIFIDKQSGKNFDRPQYQILKSALRENDLLIIKSIDRLGRNYNMILEEWRDITKNIKADIKVLDMPILDTSKNKDLLGSVINDIILTLLSYVADGELKRIHTRQREGIDLCLKTGKTKTGNPMGRPKIKKPDNWDLIYSKWKNKEITGRQAQKELGLKSNKFYSLVKGQESK